MSTLGGLRYSITYRALLYVVDLTGSWSLLMLLFSTIVTGNFLAFRVCETKFVVRLPVGHAKDACGGNRLRDHMV